MYRLKRFASLWLPGILLVTGCKTGGLDSAEVKDSADPQEQLVAAECKKPLPNLCADNLKELEYLEINSAGVPGSQQWE